MLESGEIDELYSAMVPPSMIAGSRRIRTLFDDPEVAGREYFKRTGIFPIQHIVAIQKEVYRENPWIARSLYEAFNEAKRRAEELYRSQSQHLHRLFMIPWLSSLIERNRALMGDDPWPYGLKANHKSLDTFLRYHHEHGLSKRRFKPEELFVPETLDT
jgi:4,5-dihydroxyphthalate decarboxylase